MGDAQKRVIAGGETTERPGEKASLPPNADSPRMKGADSGTAEGVPRISLCTSAAL